MEYNTKTYTRANKDFLKVCNNLKLKVKSNQATLIFRDVDLFVYQENNKPKTYALFTDGAFGNIIKIKVTKPVEYVTWTTKQKEVLI